MSDTAIETRLREVEKWQAEHGGSCQVRNVNQEVVNAELFRRVGALEWKVAWIAGAAAAVGAILGSFGQRFF